MILDNVGDMTREQIMEMQLCVHSHPANGKFAIFWDAMNHTTFE